MRQHRVFGLRTALTATAVLLGALISVPTGAATKYITVSSLLDDGSAGTLRWAIQQAHTGSKKTPATITFASGLSGSILLSAPLDAIYIPMTIMGSGITIDGGNAFQILAVSSTGRLTLNSLTIVGGFANGVDSLPVGGAVYNEGSLTLTNCVLSGNFALMFGGAIYSSNGAATTIDGCYLLGNGISALPGEPAVGGAVCVSDGFLTATNSVFQDNVALGVVGSDGLKGYSGGGAIALINSNVTTTVWLIGCTFESNVTGENGGAVWADSELVATDCWFVANECRSEGESDSAADTEIPVGGAAIFASNFFSGQAFSATLNHDQFLQNRTTCDTDAAIGGALLVMNESMKADRCGFWNNQALSTAAPLYREDGTIDHTFTSLGAAIACLGDTVLTDSLIFGNVAGDPLADPVLHPSFCGGVLASTLSVTNCTISANRANNIPALGAESTLALANSIVWANISGTPEGIAIFAFGSATVSFTDVQGCGGSGTTWFDGIYLVDGGGNIDADPLFVDGANGDLHVGSGSPCINTGSVQFVAKSSKVDLDGKNRITGRSVDMGAYEYQKSK